MQFFQNNLKSIPQVEYKRLKDVCRIRNVERIDGLARFTELFRTIWSVLNRMRNNEVIENCEGDTNGGDEIANKKETNEEGEEQDDKAGTKRYELNPTTQNDAENLMNACSSISFIALCIETRRVLASTKQTTILIKRKWILSKNMT